MMTLKGVIMSLCSILLVVAALCSASQAVAGEVGTITFADGRVDILKPGQDLAIPADEGATVGVKDVVRTKNNSRAEITFLDKSVIRMAEGTRIEVASYVFDENTGGEERVVHLTRGRVRAILAGELPSIEILTPNANADAVGNDFYVIHEKGSTWLYGTDGFLIASSMSDPDDSIRVKRRSCVRVTSGIPLRGSCIFKEIDVEKYGWDTAARESVPVVAQLPSEEGTVYTYTPFGGPALATPSQPVPIAFQDLVCTQCPSLAIPLTVAAEASIPLPTVKMGNFERIDKCCAPIPPAN